MQEKSCIKTKHLPLPDHAVFEVTTDAFNDERRENLGKRLKEFGLDVSSILDQSMKQSAPKVSTATVVEISSWHK